MLVGGSPDEAFLKGRSFGPYHGRVVDAETGAPLAGAVVVAVWDRRRNGLAHSYTVRYTARETLTDPDGRFVLDVRALEEWAPTTTEPPTFRVFAPGYAYYRQGFSALADATVTGPFSRDGAGLRLRRLGTAKKRRRHLPDLYEPLDKGNPFKKLPHFARLVNREMADLGLPPHTEEGYRRYLQVRGW